MDLRRFEGLDYVVQSQRTFKQKGLTNPQRNVDTQQEVGLGECQVHSFFPHS